MDVRPHLVSNSEFYLSLHNNIDTFPSFRREIEENRNSLPDRYYVYCVRLNSEVKLRMFVAVRSNGDGVANGLQQF